MLVFEEGRNDFDVEFNGKEYRISRERGTLEGQAYEKISILDNDGLVFGLEYTKESFDDFEILSQRDNSEVEIYERGLSEEIDLEEFRRLYSNLNGGELDLSMDKELSGTETAETYTYRR